MDELRRPRRQPPAPIRWRWRQSPTPGGDGFPETAIQLAFARWSTTTRDGIGHKVSYQLLRKTSQTMWGQPPSAVRRASARRANEVPAPATELSTHSTKFIYQLLRDLCGCTFNVLRLLRFLWNIQHQFSADYRPAPTALRRASPSQRLVLRLPVPLTWHTAAC